MYHIRYFHPNRDKKHSKNKANQNKPIHILDVFIVDK